MSYKLQKKPHSILFFFFLVYLYKGTLQSHKIFDRKIILSSGKLVLDFVPVVYDLQLQVMSLDSVLLITPLFHFFFFISCNLLPCPAALERKLSILLPICLYIISI